jgi:hypothetical protein
MEARAKAENRSLSQTIETILGMALGHKQYIQPLSKTEKEQLLQDVQRMLQEEELREMGFVPGTVCEIVTPNITTDVNADIEAAASLEKLLEEAGSAI